MASVVGFALGRFAGWIELVAVQSLEPCVPVVLAVFEQDCIFAESVGGVAAGAAMALTGRIELVA